MHKQKFKIDEINLVLIVALIVFILSIYSKANEPKALDSDKIIQMINAKFNLEEHGVIDKNRLQEFKKIEYTTLKNSLNIKNDFCIYIEDENGHVLFSKGSSKLTRDGIPCNE